LAAWIKGWIKDTHTSKGLMLEKILANVIFKVLKNSARGK